MNIFRKSSWVVIKKKRSRFSLQRQDTDKTDNSLGATSTLTVSDSNTESYSSARFNNAIRELHPDSYGIVLCPICRSIFGGAYREGTGEVHDLDQTLEDVEEAANAGCGICLYRWYQLSIQERADLKGCTKIKFGFWSGARVNSLFFEYYYPEDGKSRKGNLVWKTLMVIPEEDAVTYLKDCPTSPASNTGSSESLEAARRWVTQCCEHHDLCPSHTRCQPSSRCSLPTRLIDLGTDADIKPRLVLSSNLSGCVKYMTLSHCWGSLSFTTLTSSNLSSMQESIPLDAITRSFRDAMTITHKLGCRYLWIDSLCIIQDSDSDWWREGARISLVYKNSLCNIAAAHAQDGSIGCFTSHDPASLQPCRVRINWKGLPRGLECVCIDGGLWARNIEDSILQTRAWAIQELILSPRVLHFTADQIFWECAELQACETFPGGIPRKASDKLAIDPAYLRKAFNSSFASSGLSVDHHRLWHRIVSKYSAANLSFPAKDKLIAIAGLAQSIGLPSSDYLAGLWRPNLLTQLLWWTDVGHRVSALGASRSKEKTLRPAYQAPSWSWAAINSPVKAWDLSPSSFPSPAGDGNELTHIISASTRPRSPGDYFGAVLSGALHVRGPVYKGLVSDFCRIRTSPSSSYSDLGAEDTHRPHISGLPVDMTFDHDDFPNPEERLGSLFFLGIKKSEDGNVLGLVLQRAGEERGRYERKGYFELRDRRHGGDDDGVTPESVFSGMASKGRGKETYLLGLSREEYTRVGRREGSGGWEYELVIV